jgi:ABC-type branched-subunit amino acid transport system ATPase component
MHDDSAPASNPNTGPEQQLELDRPGTVAAADDAELAVPYWLTSTEEAANTTFLRMVRRLPRLLRDAWRLAWQASAPTTAAVLLLQLGAGVASALTARANITIGRHDRPLDVGNLHEAARAGDAHEFVMELPRQYDTMLSRHFTDGADLSGGPWQRLALSRAFYRDAPLLICDEPTANLDARAEHAVYRRLRELAAGRTVVLITHRMASVREADRIYVLDHGVVVEQGDHRR